MNLKVKETSYSVKPKQDEGKLVARFERYDIKPKARGVKIYKNKLTAVLKHDRRYGVKIQKQKLVRMLHRWD